jgi:hypothetical protein
MKRLVLTVLTAAFVASAFGQGTFTIRRPAEGSTVRETVKVRIPKNSIPEGGYVAIKVNGKFLEAVIPDVEGDDYVYNLNSKDRKLADGPVNIEAVLYFYTQGAPQVLNRTSVNVNLDNSTSIQGRNPDGFNLRYRFNPGLEYVYNMKRDQVVSFVTQAQAQLGSRAAEVVLDTQTIRYLVAHHNNYGSEGLIRFQALPEKGKDYAYLITSQNPEPTKFMDFEMHPIFMRVTNTGREVFTSLPTYFPWEGTGEDARTDLFALFPLPVLPTRKVEVGDSWQAAFPQGQLDLDKRHEKDKYVANLVGRATLEAVEWEQGIPCARIRSELSLGAADLKNLTSLDNVQGQAQSVKLESVQWFALDRGILVREEERMTSEILVEVGGASGGGQGDSGAGRAGGGAPSSGGNPGTAGATNNRIIPAYFMSNQLTSLFNPSLATPMMQQRRGGPATPGAAPGGQEGFGNGNGGRGGSGGTGSVGQKVILRQQSRTSVILER